MPAVWMLESPQIRSFARTKTSTRTETVIVRSPDGEVSQKEIEVPFDSAISVEDEASLVRIENYVHEPDDDRLIVRFRLGRANVAGHEWAERDDGFVVSGHSYLSLAISTAELSHAELLEIAAELMRWQGHPGNIT